MLFLGKNEPAPAGKNIIGDWTFHHIADSSIQQKNNIGLLTVSVLVKDSAVLKITFNNDSSYHIYQLPAHTIDSGKYYPDNSFKTLFIVSDSVAYPLLYKTIQTPHYNCFL